MPKRFLLFVFCCAVSFCLASCATFRLSNYESIADNVRMGNYLDSVGIYKKIRHSNSNAIQWKMDLALLEHFAGLYEDSIELMNEVHELMEDSVTKSITQGIGAAVLNDNLVSYSSTAYEYLFVNAFNALNYYRAGDFDEALVEVRRIGNKQREYLSKYGEAVKSEAVNAAEKLKSQTGEDAESLSIDMGVISSKSPSPPTDADIYRDSSFARYVSMIFRMMDGDIDNARVDARALASINSNIPVDEVLSVASEKTKGRIDFLAFGGLISHRKEKVVYFPGDFLSIPYIALKINGIDIPAFRIKFAYPIYDTASAVNAVSSVRVVLSDGTTKNLSLLEDFNNAVKMDISSKASSIYMRSVIRTLAKKAVAVTTGAASLYATKQAILKQREAAKKKGSKNSSFSGDLMYALAYAGVVSAIEAVDISEKADIRQCIFLPQASYAGGFALDAGTYSGKIQFLDFHEKILYEENFENITVKSGKTVLMESACLQ